MVGASQGIVAVAAKKLLAVCGSGLNERGAATKTLRPSVPGSSLSSATESATNCWVLSTPSEGDVVRASSPLRESS